MSKPVVKLFIGGAITAIAIGDTYKDPESGKEVVYEVAKIRIDLTKNKNNLSFTKEVWEAMLDMAQSDEVVAKLARDWR
jgi:hypothetical protein